jgi:hypothetical protein
VSEKKLEKPENIESKIYTLRGVQVILDKDLAIFYDVKPIRLREQVKRNIKRFPSDFMFQLTDEEVDLMVSHNAIPSRQYLGGSMPYVFTEQGVGALSAVLTSDRAVEVSIQIMRAFVSMRKFILTNAQIFQRLDTLEIKQTTTDKKLNQVLSAIESKDIQPKQGIFFDGQVFDAYVFVADLVKSAKKSIILIDNYVDESVLILFAKRKKGVTLTILTKTISDKLALDVKKFQEQYQPVALKIFDKAHDRFLIIDEKIVYHFGASLKDLGKKWFAFSKMDISAFEILKEIGRLV